MAAAIGGVAGVLESPGVVDTPYVSGNGVVGQVLELYRGQLDRHAGLATRTNGSAAGLRRGSSSTELYPAAGDSTHSVGCAVTATNATGSTAAPLSNECVRLRTEGLK